MTKFIEVSNQLTVGSVQGMGRSKKGNNKNPIRRFLIPVNEIMILKEGVPDTIVDRTIIILKDNTQLLPAESYDKIIKMIKALDK